MGAEKKQRYNLKPDTAVVVVVYDRFIKTIHTFVNVTYNIMIYQKYAFGTKIQITIKNQRDCEVFKT